MTLVLVLGATVVFAQDGGRIGLFADQAGTNCAIVDAAPGLLPVYVVHIMTGGATACQYAAPKPPCFTATYLADTNVFGVTVGNSQTGVSIGYGLCKNAPILLQTISFLAAGTSSTCCIYPVACDPLSTTGACALGKLDVVDCSENFVLAAGQSGVVNSTVDCTCTMIVPERDSSWGQIKALYSE
jgi:hypothetical protein